MEYSLHTLNESSILKTLTSQNLIDTLNLIGFEIDEVFEEQLLTNKNIANLRLLIKIPANREDLLSEKTFLNELSRLFNFSLQKKWEKSKIKYNAVLNTEYKNYKNFQQININSNLNDIVCFKIKIKKNKNFSTPLWIEKKLLNSGIQPKKNIEDLLTLNTLEWGNTFDFSVVDIINNTNLKIEQLQKSITFKNSEDKTYNLTPGTIVIKNEAGEIKEVLGIFNSNCIANEKNEIFVQSLFYNVHDNILNLNALENKISLRHLRQICLQNYRESFQRLLTLLDLTGAAKILPVQYIYNNTNKNLQIKKKLKLRKVELKNLMNINFPDNKIFKKAGLKLICENRDFYYFSIPFGRNDLTREIDLIEEYARFVGYKNIKGHIPKKSLAIQRTNEKNKVFIKQFFLNYGFSEILTNPFQGLNKKSESSVVITNPLNNDFGILRESIIEKMVNIFVNNTRLVGKPKNLFEIGRIFKNQNKKLIEEEKLGVVFQLKPYQQRNDDNENWFIAKGFLEILLRNFSNHYLFIKASPKNKFFHPNRSIEIKLKNRHVGLFGELRPNNKFKIKQPTYIFEINLKYLLPENMESSIPIYKEYSKYPAVTKDISVCISKNINFSELKNKIESTSNLLELVQFFNIYLDKHKINHITVGIRLTFQSDNQTLRNQEIELELQKINSILIEKFDAELNT